MAEEDDPLTHNQQRLNQDLMRTFMGMPSVLNAALEGQEGPTNIPPEQYAAVMTRSVEIMLRHLPNIAGASDVAIGRVGALEARVAELERRLDAR
jgi:hypothetical protein